MAHIPSYFGGRFVQPKVCFLASSHWIIGVIQGLYRDYRRRYSGYIGIMEKKMETTI